MQYLLSLVPFPLLFQPKECFVAFGQLSKWSFVGLSVMLRYIVGRFSAFVFSIIAPCSSCISTKSPSVIRTRNLTSNVFLQFLSISIVPWISCQKKHTCSFPQICANYIFCWTQKYHYWVYGPVTPVLRFLLRCPFIFFLHANHTIHNHSKRNNLFPFCLTSPFTPLCDVLYQLVLPDIGGRYYTFTILCQLMTLRVHGGGRLDVRKHHFSQPTLYYFLQ